VQYIPGSHRWPPADLQREPSGSERRHP
jgi:hypothetical protein